MDIEHFRFLSWFSDRTESHEQDGEILRGASPLRVAAVSSDPAMAFEPSVVPGPHVAPGHFPAAMPPDLAADASAIRSNLRGTHPRKNSTNVGACPVRTCATWSMIYSENRYPIFGIML
jgi:hypothetical protein